MISFNDCINLTKLLLDFLRFWNDRSSKTKDPPAPKQTKEHKKQDNQSETNKPI